jgi:hypothetical protein
MTDELKDLIEAAKKEQPTPEQREQQRRSFAYGNGALENELITREMIGREAEKLSQENDGAAGPQGLLYRNGWYVLPSRGGIVTNEMIDKIQEELDREDARIAGCESSSGADEQ